MNPSKLIAAEGRIPARMGNKLVNRSEEWIKPEVYGLYKYLKSQDSMSRAPHRFKDILRGSLNGTTWGYFVTGLVSVAAAEEVDRRIANGGAARESIQRDHIFPWYESALHWVESPLLDIETFW